VTYAKEIVTYSLLYKYYYYYISLKKKIEEKYMA